MHVQGRGAKPVKEIAYQQLKGVDQNPPPFSAPQNEIEAYNKFTQRIKKTEENKPSLLAKLSKEIVKSSPTLQMIDHIYSAAMEDYKAALDDALYNDFAKSANPSARNNIVDFRNAVASGAQNMTRFIPNVIIIQHIFALILPLIGASIGMVYQEHYTRAKINLENSEHRQKWLNEVRILEIQREKQIRNLISQRVSVLTKNIEENPDLINLSSIEELRALNQLYQSMNSEKPLLIQGKTVTNYIEMINVDETEDFPLKQIIAQDVKKSKSSKSSSNSKLTISNDSKQGIAEAKKKK